jgi:SulP family sulfate permease
VVPVSARPGWKTLGADLEAGLTVALVALPQAIAYAMLAGVPPAYGLSTAAVSAVVAAAAGRSAQVATGPTNTTGLLILAALTPVLADNGLIRADALPVLATLTLLAGVIRLVVALGGGAGLVRFLPDSVLVGFTLGAATLIGGMQLDEALGLPPVRSTNLRTQMTGILAHLGDVHLAAVGCSAITVVVVGFGRHLAPRAPLPLLAVLGSTVMAWGLGLDGRRGLPLVLDRSAVPAGWPAIALPTWNPEVIERLLIPASAVVLLGTLELAVSARARGERADMRREIMAQGWANVVGAFTGCFPASASFTRSALLRMAGARTRWAAAMSGLAVLPVVFFGAPLVARIPQASLAGVVLVVAYNMIDRHSARRLWRASGETRLLLVLTFVATLVLPIEWAIFIGSGTGLVIHLAKTSAPRLRLLKPGGAGLVPVAPGETPDVVVLEVSGDLHYAAVPPFLSEAERLLPARTRLVILDLAHAHEMRFSGLRGVEHLAQQLARHGATLWLAGVDGKMQALLERSESPLPWVAAEAEPGLSVRKCLAALRGEA